MTNETTIAKTRAADWLQQAAKASKLAAKTEYEDACDALLKLLTTPSEENRYDAIVAQRAAAKAARRKYEKAIKHARNADDRAAMISGN